MKNIQSFVEFTNEKRELNEAKLSSEAFDRASGSTESLESIKAKAKKQSKEEGCVVHVNKSGSGYVLDDWFDSEKTVASYENGRSLNESNEMLNSVSDDIITAAISIELKPNLFVHTIHGNGVHVEFGSNVKLETIEKLSKELVKMGRDVKTTRNGEKSELVVNESEGSINESTIKGGWSFSYRYRTSKGPDPTKMMLLSFSRGNARIEAEEFQGVWKAKISGLGMATGKRVFSNEKEFIDYMSSLGVDMDSAWKKIEKEWQQEADPMGGLEEGHEPINEAAKLVGWKISSFRHANGLYERVPEELNDAMTKFLLFVARLASEKALVKSIIEDWKANADYSDTVYVQDPNNNTLPIYSSSGMFSVGTPRPSSRAGQAYDGLIAQLKTFASTNESVLNFIDQLTESIFSLVNFPSYDLFEAAVYGPDGRPLNIQPIDPRKAQGEFEKFLAKNRIVFGPDYEWRKYRIDGCMVMSFDKEIAAKNARQVIVRNSLWKAKYIGSEFMMGIDPKTGKDSREHGYTSYMVKILNLEDAYSAKNLAESELLEANGPHWIRTSFGIEIDGNKFELRGDQNMGYTDLGKNKFDKKYSYTGPKTNLRDLLAKAEQICDQWNEAGNGQWFVDAGRFGDLSIYYRKKIGPVWPEEIRE